MLTRFTLEGRTDFKPVQPHDFDICQQIHPRVPLLAGPGRGCKREGFGIGRLFLSWGGEMFWHPPCFAMQLAGTNFFLSSLNGTCNPRGQSPRPSPLND